MVHCVYLYKHSVVTVKQLEKRCKSGGKHIMFKMSLETVDNTS